MKTYKYGYDGGVGITDSNTGAFMYIPPTLENSDWVAFLKIKDSLQIQAADPPPDLTPVSPSVTPRFQKVITKVNASALPAGTKTALLDILGTLVDNL